MEIEDNEAADTRPIKEKCFFCSASCKDKFAADPPAFLKKLSSRWSIFPVHASEVRQKAGSCPKWDGMSLLSQMPE
jgi:YHS domain-containing protein